jgi:hypothetical protein
MTRIHTTVGGNSKVYFMNMTEKLMSMKQTFEFPPTVL